MISDYVNVPNYLLENTTYEEPIYEDIGEMILFVISSSVEVYFVCSNL